MLEIQEYVPTPPLRVPTDGVDVGPLYGLPLGTMLMIVAAIVLLALLLAAAFKRERPPTEMTP